MIWRTLLVCLIVIPLLSHCWWDLRSVAQKPASKYHKLHKRDEDTTAVDYNDWQIWPNATKDYNATTCENELRPYAELPEIVTDIGTSYDLGDLNTFKEIGESFLEMVQRETLYDTIVLAMDLDPLDSLDKILQLIEYQIVMFLLVAFGLLTATLILIAYSIFWSMKLTGNIKEVDCQRIADSEGPMRIILTFLLCFLTIFVIFGCIIAFVANTHITNNVSEASNHIEWTVNVTENFTADIQEQMETVFINQYKETFLEIMRTRVDQSVINASAVVYLVMAQNISDTYNKSLMLANSITDVQYNAFIELKSLYDEHYEKLYQYTSEINYAQSCLETLDNWCDLNDAECDSDKDIASGYLTSVDPDKLYYANINSSTEAVMNISDNGAIGASARAAYLNGRYFHNGSLEDSSTVFYSDAPTYSLACHKTDMTTGVLLVTQDGDADTTNSTYHDDNPDNSISVDISCEDLSGCRVGNTSTTLLWGYCCIDIQYFLDQSDPNVNNSDFTVCGSDQYWLDGVLQEGGQQSNYRGNASTTVSGQNCRAWSDVTAAGSGGTKWPEYAAAAGYDGLYWNDDSDNSTELLYCRNPWPYSQEDDDDDRSRAWCFTGTGSSSWEYCNVPFCANDTTRALANTTAVLHYSTCDELEAELYGGTVANSENFTMWVTTETAREEAYFSLDEAADEIDAQFEVIQEAFDTSNAAFDELQEDILSSIAAGSDASKWDDYRNTGTIVIVCFCMASACLAVAGVCMGFCNISDVPPHLRTSACSLGGTLIKVSSYWAAMMAIINLYMATLFFLPGATFSLICTDFYAGDLFNLFDNRVIVNYSILGRAVLENDTRYSMTFKNLWLSCGENNTLWVSLGLSDDPDYNLVSLLQINESIDVSYTFTQLRDEVISNDFSNFSVYPTNLEFWISFWNASNATQLAWDEIKDNFDNGFLGLTETLMDNDDLIDGKSFCESFDPYGSQYSSADESAAKTCADHFKENMSDLCDEWQNDYSAMSTAIADMLTQVELIESEWSNYGDTFVADLMEEYTWTNNRLLNKDDAKFSLELIDATYDYWEPVLNNEVECFSWQLNYSMDNELSVCYPVAKIFNNTFDYFCNYMVTSMTLAWISQGVLGIILALHMLVAGALSTYFLKMEKRHPGDISKEEIIAAFE